MVNDRAFYQHPLKIVLATGNKNKLKEVKEIASGYYYDGEILSMKEAGFIENDIEENGNTFEENSFIKSKTVFNELGMACIADDSGLIVDFLSDEKRNEFYPGIISARFFSIAYGMFVNGDKELINKYPLLYEKIKENITDPENEIISIEKATDSKDRRNYLLLLEIMKNTSVRSARFVCCATYVDCEKDISVFGNVEGEIMTEPSKASNGFGYDPVFFASEKKKCVSEMDDEEKNSISHRGKAVRGIFENIL